MNPASVTGIGGSYSNHSAPPPSRCHPASNPLCAFLVPALSPLGTWSLELYQQANARLHRQGQKHTVFIHHLVVEGSVDEDVMTALQKKGDCQTALLEALKARVEKYMQMRQEERRV